MVAKHDDQRYPTGKVTLPMGYHAFHWEATDSAGNKADCQFVVAVDTKKCKSFTDDRSQDWLNNFKIEQTDRSCVNRDGATVRISCKDESKKMRFSTAMMDDDSAKYLSAINAHCKNGQWLDPTLIATCVETDESDYDDGGELMEYEDTDVIDDDFSDATQTPSVTKSENIPYDGDDDTDENEPNDQNSDYGNDSQNSDQPEDESDSNVNSGGTGGGGTVVIIIVLLTLFAIGGTIAFKRYKDNIKIAQNLGRTILSGKDNGGMNLGGDTNQAYSPM